MNLNSNDMACIRIEFPVRRLLPAKPPDSQFADEDYGEDERTFVSQALDSISRC